MRNNVLLTFLGILFISSNAFSQANNNSLNGFTNLGKVSVYKFRADSLYYTNEKNKRLTAVGTEFEADLYASKLGNNTFFKILINGESYAVVSRAKGDGFIPYNTYYRSCILKNGKYVSVPTLTHKAGQYFLNIPYSETSNYNNNPNQLNGNNLSVKSSNVTSNAKSGIEQFVGVWKSSGDKDFGDIKIFVDNNKLSLQMKTDDGLKSFAPDFRDNMISWSYTVSEGYGKWETHSDQFNVYHYLIGEGYSYNDKVEVFGGNWLLGKTKANREVLSFCYSAKLNNGNLDIKRSYRYEYFNNSEYQFFRYSPFTSNAIYTQW